MNTDVILSKREDQIAELFAWGASKKEVASLLFISERTVEAHTRNIYEKLGINKINELSAWFFCTHYNVSVSLSPFKKALAVLFAVLVLAAHISQSEYARTGIREAAARVRTCARACSKTLEGFGLFDFNE